MVPYTCNYNDVYNALAQRSYELKMETIGARLYKFISQEFKDLYTVGRTLRNGTQIIYYMNKQLDKKDIYDRLYTLNSRYQSRECPKKICFDIGFAKQESSRLNREVGIRIAKRKAEEKKKTRS